MPTVSVVMSTYNRAERFLPQAIESVLSQTYKDFELIIVDDCSTDSTQQVVESYQDERIRYIKLDENSGSDTKPKNVGISAAHGKYIAYIDDDCEWYSYHLEILASHLDNNPSVDVAYCDMILYNADDPTALPSKGISLDFNSQFLLRRNFIDTSCVIHRKEMAYNVGGFDQTLPKFVDWNMWVRMMKWGARFDHVAVVATKYYVHNQAKSVRVKTKSWVDPITGMTMFEPTFDPSGCYIHGLSYLFDQKVAEREKKPKVAIYTITYDRLEYTKEMHQTMRSSTEYPFDWFVFDNGSQDETPDWLAGSDAEYIHLSPDNKGITNASNHLVEEIMKRDYDIVIKVDNDARFMTKEWLETIVDLWKRNHKLYMSPYPEGLVSNPGGAPRVGSAYIGPYLVEVTMHIGGFVAAIDAHAYKNFRWSDQFLHGNQDTEASMSFRKMGYMPCYIPIHRAFHMDGTVGQHKKFPQYFERRKKEKTSSYKGDGNG